MATDDINHPDFFRDSNLENLERTTAATFSDYGPGPNETMEHARNASAFARTSNPVFETQTVPIDDPVEKLADAVLARVLDKLGKMEK